MPRPYPAEFRARAIALVRAGKPAKDVAFELGIHPVTLSKWMRRDAINAGARPGASVEGVRRAAPGTSSERRDSPLRLSR